MSTSTALATDAAPEALTTSLTRELIAPPFDGWQRAATPADPGFWTAVFHNAGNGGSVAQLGVRPHPPNSPPAQGDLLVGWQTHRQLPAGPMHFTAYFDLGPISRAPRGGTVTTLVYFLVNGPSGLFGDVVEVFRGSPDVALVATSFGRSIQAGSYRFRCGSFIHESYAGSANPYGEVILHGIRLFDDQPGRTGLAGETVNPLVARLDAKDDVLRLLDVEPPLGEVVRM